MKKRLIFCALIVCALCGGYNDVMAALPDPAEEGTVFHSNVVVVRRDTLNENEDELSDDCKKVLTQRNAIYHPANGTLPGMFSVADQPRDSFGIDKKYVRFSKGNLQYMPESYQGAACYKFAEHQYDYIARGESTPGLYDATANQWCDLLKATKDWTAISVYNGGGLPNTWRALTYDELCYLFCMTERGRVNHPSRQTASGKLLWFQGSIMVHIQTAMGEVDSVSGLFLLPDYFPTETMKVTEDSIPVEDWCEVAGTTVYADHKISLHDFERLEEQGVVFFPYMGYAKYNAYSLSYELVFSASVYWTSTPNSWMHRRLTLAPQTVSVDGGTDSGFGGCVRLVQSVTY